MHLGNARTALLAWLDVRSRGGEMVLRIEDLDRDRCRAEYADLLRRDLAWLGLDWDRETEPQSGREPAYREAVDRLQADGLVYECFCSRRELRIASAPHGSSGEHPYPGTCRTLTAAQRAARAGRRSALRLRMPQPPVAVDDRLAGRIEQRIADAVGDIVIRRSDEVYAYQLAVVVDDAADGVTDVVRGDDLLWSTPRQVAVGRMLGLPQCRYAHVPLVLGDDGTRLSKRHGAVAVAGLRDSGVAPERVIGVLASSAGFAPAGTASSPADLVDGFRLAGIRRAPASVDDP